MTAENRPGERDPLETITARAKAGYPPAPGPIQAEAVLRIDKGWVMDLRFAHPGAPFHGKEAGWTFGVQRAGATKAAKHVAFCAEGSREFAPLTRGVGAVALAVAKAIDAVVIDRPEIEFGLQTPARQEFFLTKGTELAGQLLIEKAPLGEQYPWLATLIDRPFRPSS